MASAAVVTADSVHAVGRRNAEIAAGNLVAGMADQETALLTFLQPAAPDSASLYEEGRRETERSLIQLRTGTAGTADAQGFFRHKQRKLGTEPGLIQVFGYWLLATGYWLLAPRPR